MRVDLKAKSPFFFLAPLRRVSCRRTDLVLLALTIARVSPICFFSNQSRLSFILVRDQVFAIFFQSQISPK